MKRIPELVKYIIPTDTAALELLEEILKQLPPNSAYALPLLLTDVVENAWQTGSKHYIAKVNSLLRKHGVYPVGTTEPARQCPDCQGTSTVLRTCYMCSGTRLSRTLKCQVCHGTGSTGGKCYACTKGVIPPRTTWRFDARVRRLPMQGW